MDDNRDPLGMPDNFQFRDIRAFGFRHRQDKFPEL
jgi:hypothetical protein